MHEIDLMLKLQLEGKHEEARKLSDKLERIGPKEILDGHGKNTTDIWMRHCFNRGWFLIQDGLYQEGCQLLENGRFLNVYGSGPLRTNAPIFNPKEHEIKGKSIIISLEGGYGDEIIHARFATSFKKQGADKVYLAAAPELVSLLSRIEGVDAVILRNQANTVAHDYWVPGFSAGWISGHTFENFPGDPYLIENSDSVEIWKTMIAAEEGQVKVGIRWAGNPKFEHQQFRRFPENFMLNLAKHSKFKVFSLQRDNNIVALPENVTDLQHLLISWEDTAAAIMNLDIVITSCTSIAHLAAALGKETWIVIPCLPYHTWTYGAPDSTTSPYYKCVKLFRQKKYGKWNETFQDLYSALEEKFDLDHIEMPNEDKEIKRLKLGHFQKPDEDNTSTIVPSFKLPVTRAVEGYLTQDIDTDVIPDEIDLNDKVWPWKDDEFGHIVAKNVLEYLGDTKEDFVNIIKEMYRISENGAIWEIEVPHSRCDLSLDDPYVKRIITPGSFDLFNKKMLAERIKTKDSISLIAFEQDVDIEICDVQYRYAPHWDARIKSGQITQEELTYSLLHLNNVAMSTILLIQVHKPGRVAKEDITTLLK